MAPTTAFVQARRVLGASCDRTEVDWAVSMLEANQEGASLAMLAADSPPHNHFELAPLRDRALEEVDAAPVEVGWALYVYAAEILRDALADGGDLDGAFRTLKALYLQNQDDDALLDFYLLAFAQDALRAGQDQWEWPGATVETIDSVMRHRAEAFVQDVDARGPASQSTRPRLRTVRQR